MIVAALSIVAAQLVFDNARIASAEDAGKLWGKPLYGPMMIVDRNTRGFVRNDGTNGTLPKETIVANTATAIDGKLTTMIALQSLGKTAVQQRRLAMHECWHRIQNETETGSVTARPSYAQPRKRATAGSASASRTTAPASSTAPSSSSR